MEYITFSIYQKESQKNKKNLINKSKKNWFIEEIKNIFYKMVLFLFFVNFI